jgi:hypothetical protein
VGPDHQVSAPPNSPPADLFQIDLITPSDPARRSELNIYIEIPPGTGAKQLTVTIASKHLIVGIKGNPPYLDVSDGGKRFSLHICVVLATRTVDDS